MATTIKCSACGHENPVGQKFCGECGAKLASAPPPAPPVPKEIVCLSCGAKPAPGMKFCQECGAKLEDAGSEAPAAEKPELKLGEVVMLDPDFQPFNIKIEGGKRYEKSDSPQYHFDEWMTFKIPASLDPNNGDHAASIYAIKHTETYKGNYEGEYISHVDLKMISWSPRFGTDAQFYLNAAECLDGLYDFVFTFDEKPVACVTLDFAYEEQ